MTPMYVLPYAMSSLRLRESEKVLEVYLWKLKDKRLLGLVLRR